jgi:heptosyltransferase II
MTFFLRLIEKLVPPFEPPVATTSIRKILLVDLNFLGDMLMGSPVYRALKEHIVGAQIDMLGLTVAAPALKANPFIDRLHLINRTDVFTLLRTAQMLRKEEFDLVLQLNTSLKTNVLMWMIGRRFRLGYNFAHRGCCNNIRIPLARRTTRVGSRVDECADLLEKAFGWSVVDRSTIFSVPAEAEEGMRRVLSGEDIHSGSVLIGMHTNCRQGHAQRRWGGEKFAELANRLIEVHNATILLTGGPEDREYTEEIARAISVPARVKNLAGKLSLLEFAALLKNLRVFVTINTGPMHIAIALRTPTVAIIGGTPPSVVFPANDACCQFIADPALDQWNPAELYPSYSPLIQTIKVRQVLEKVEFLLASRKARTAQGGLS